MPNYELPNLSINIFQHHWTPKSSSTPLACYMNQLVLFNIYLAKLLEWNAVSYWNDAIGLKIYANGKSIKYFLPQTFVFAVRWKSVLKLRKKYEYREIWVAFWGWFSKRLCRVIFFLNSTSKYQSQFEGLICSWKNLKITFMLKKGF